MKTAWGTTLISFFESSWLNEHQKLVLHSSGRNDTRPPVCLGSLPMMTGFPFNLGLSLISTAAKRHPCRYGWFFWTDHLSMEIWAFFPFLVSFFIYYTLFLKKWKKFNLFQIYNTDCAENRLYYKRKCQKCRFSLVEIGYCMVYLSHECNRWLLLEKMRTLTWLLRQLLKHKIIFVIKLGKASKGVDWKGERGISRFVQANYTP